VLPGNSFCRCSGFSLLLPLSQSHPGATAVLINELDARAFECSANR
jgi:hypothetical protein